ncbi:MAG: hypothetical protein UX26_C0013G0003 [Parcubacteria group bacterium GW2011_GWC1_45_9]|nr:MAG: hypothetical protein UW85_C0001G0006 [Parcubacteria group bacterium GW2011_GWA1_Parcubacteria_45_10]KKT87685.1 MAG: hypothetical protein UW89_C0020G0003 [Parcubacteria group bacterium GW2011_GWB1_45_10]KKU16888.1 MAG: hypothetical protein UX26_C0013G0003 [Parcubacteria group bacterium GW2011_GWC1_45_9]
MIGLKIAAVIAAAILFFFANLFIELAIKADLRRVGRWLGKKG